MLELIVFAEEVFAEAALEDAAAKIPDSALAFGADHVHQRTRASVSLQTLPTVADEGLAKVADRTHHTHAWPRKGTMVENGKKHRQNCHPIIHCPTSEGVSEVSERCEGEGRKGGAKKESTGPMKSVE